MATSVFSSTTSCSKDCTYIAPLKAQVKQQDQQIEELETQVKQRDQQIEELRCKNDELVCKTNSQAKLLAAMKKDLVKEQGRSSHLKSKLSEKNKENNELKRANINLKHANADLEQKFKAKDQEISELTTLVGLLTEGAETAEERVRYLRNVIFGTSSEKIKFDADADQPATEANQPAADASQQDAEANQPPVDASQPAVEANQPATDASQQDAEANQPAANVNQPATDASQQDAEANQLAADASQQDAEANKPATNTSQDAKANKPAAGASQQEEETNKPAAKAKKHREGTDRFSSNIPHIDRIYTLDPEELLCPHCSYHLKRLGFTKSRSRVIILPARILIVDERAVSYVCENCRDHGIVNPIYKAHLPKSPVPGSYATAEAIGYIVQQKVQYGVPLYRLAEQFELIGAPISRETMANWIIKSSEVFAPLVKLLEKELLSYDVIQADETRLQVLREPGKDASSMSWLWIAKTGLGALHAVVLVQYHPGRGAEYPKDLFAKFNGYLQSDGYAAYQTLPENLTEIKKLIGTQNLTEIKKLIGTQNLTEIKKLIGSKNIIGTQNLTGIQNIIGSQNLTEIENIIGVENTTEIKNLIGAKNIIGVACGAHMRRYFQKAYELLPEEIKDQSLAAKALGFWHKLFDLEDKFVKEGLSFEERKVARKQQAGPILKEFRNWLKEVAPQAGNGMFAKAVQYNINEWQRLVCYLKDGRIELSNNATERVAKMIAIGRKNWLFATSVPGAIALDIYYTIVATARANGVDPLSYVTWVLNELPQIENPTESDLIRFLPWNAPDDIVKKTYSAPKAVLDTDSIAERQDSTSCSS